jgi:hypothetical protein
MVDDLGSPHVRSPIAQYPLYLVHLFIHLDGDQATEKSAQDGGGDAPQGQYKAPTLGGASQ